MTDRPDASALLGQARRDLLEQLMECLPEDRRYEARLIANAMAIAAREISARDKAGTYPDDHEKLCGAIRAGTHDGDRSLYPQLIEREERRLAVVNPKRLLKGT